MAQHERPDVTEVRRIVEERLDTANHNPGAKESVTVEWRGQRISVDVISMPLKLLAYNPETHRVRAQRTLDPVRDKLLTDDPYGSAAQRYLHDLLIGDPTDPSKRDPGFEALREDLKTHSQTNPGLITRAGVLVNGNTRAAALKDLEEEHIRVGVLPTDASLSDIEDVELALQLRKEFKRDYSFVNFLLAVDERVKGGRSTELILSDFRIRQATLDRSQWVLSLIREAIDRSRATGSGTGTTALRLLDFETHQGKLEELYRAYVVLKAKSPDQADALREQRLMAIALQKSKTDVRLIEADFADKYLKDVLPARLVADGEQARKIPGTSIDAPGATDNLIRLRQLTTSVLQAKALQLQPSQTAISDAGEANSLVAAVDAAMDKGLTQAGKTGRLIKRRLAPVERLSDANDDLELTVAAVSEARSTGNFNAEDLDDALLSLKGNLHKLAQAITRGAAPTTEGAAWLVDVARLSEASP